MKTIKQTVQQEVSCCLSSLVSTLANGDAQAGTDLAELCDRALGLAMPVPDYEKAARQAGWHFQGENTPAGKMSELIFSNDPDGDPARSWQEACEMARIDPIDSEVSEHWAVSPWLAQRLLAYGEKVDTDFADLKIWARRSKDQQISADDVIVRIYAKMM